MPQSIDERRAKARAYRRKNAEKYNALNREWIRNNREIYNAAKSRYRLKLKVEIMRLYADPVRCAHCGFDKIDGLCLDHVNNDGAAHRREAGLSSRGNPAGTRIYEHIRKNGRVDGLQVLCANCNLIKQLQHSRRKTIKDPELLDVIERLYASNTPQ